MRLVQLHEHNSRFMNLQRHIWAPRSASSSGPAPVKSNVPGSFLPTMTNVTDYELQFVNPLGAISLDFLRADGFKSSALPMTPVDMYNLWTGLKKVCVGGWRIT